MTALGDQEDSPPLEPGKRHFHENTATIPPDPRVPQLEAETRTTLTPEEANRVLVRNALEASATATEALNKLLPNLATRDDIIALDRGVGAAIAAAEQASAEACGLRRDIHLWLFGDEHRPGIAQGVDATNRAAQDAFEKATAALEAATKALKVAESTYDATMHGPGAVEGKRGSGAPELEIVGGSSRPSG